MTSCPRCGGQNRRMSAAPLHTGECVCMDCRCVTDGEHGPVLGRCYGPVQATDRCHHVPSQWKPVTVQEAA